MKSQEQGGNDPAKLNSTLAAQAWGVGKPYVDPLALDVPPIAPSDRMFLPAAVAHVGRSTDPEWGEWERVTLHYPSPAVEPKLSLMALLSADRRQEPKPPSPPTISRTSHNPSYTQSKEDYIRRKSAWDAQGPERVKRAQQAIDDEQECYRRWREGVDMHGPGLRALKAAFRVLAKAVLDGNIGAYFRPTEGGKLQQLESSVLTRSGVSVGAIRSGTFDAGAKQFYLFVNALDLARVFPIIGAPTHRVGDVSMDQLSPYLQLAITVAIDREITESNPATTEGLASELEQRAAEFGLSFGGTRDDDLSRSFATEIAKAIRWPSARAGRGMGPNQKS
jgi:hypothetical protein